MSAYSNDVEEHDVEVLAVLEKHPSGLSFKSLWDKCTTFADETDLSHCLHRNVRLKLIFKREALYYSVAASSPNAIAEAKAAEIASLITKATGIEPSEIVTITPVVAPVVKEPRVIKAAIARTIVPVTESTRVKQAQLAASMLHGELRRTLIEGAVAFAAYRFRDEKYKLNISDYTAITGATNISSLRQAIMRLVKKGYLITEKDVFAGRVYMWTGKYKYPFPEVLPQDSAMIRYLPLSYRPGHTAMTTVIERPGPIVQVAGLGIQAVGTEVPVTIRVDEDLPTAVISKPVETVLDKVPHDAFIREFARVQMEYATNLAKLLERLGTN